MTVYIYIRIQALDLLKAYATCSPSASSIQSNRTHPPSQQSPLVNRCYHLRVMIIQQVIQRYLTYLPHDDDDDTSVHHKAMTRDDDDDDDSGTKEATIRPPCRGGRRRRKMIVSLGGGMDGLIWSAVRSKHWDDDDDDDDDDVGLIEVDVGEVISLKRQVLADQLWACDDDHHGHHQHHDDDDDEEKVDQHDDDQQHQQQHRHHRLITGDLRDLHALERAFREHGVLPAYDDEDEKEEEEHLFILEAVLGYMDHTQVLTLLRYVRTYLPTYLPT